MARTDFAGLTVLAVEDNAFMRNLLVRALGALGAERVSEAGDGRAALDVLESVTPDLIVTDWNMQPIDGIELTRRIRYRDRDPVRTVPIIIVTAHTEPWRSRVARDAGVNALLFKPLTPARLRTSALALLNAPYAFVETPDYRGPDRRRRTSKSYRGPERRRIGV